MAASDPEKVLKDHFARVKAVIQTEEMWERVPLEAQEFSPQNLESLVKFAYFGGFIDLAAVRQLLLLDKKEVRQRLVQWYEEIRGKAAGCVELDGRGRQSCALSHDHLVGAAWPRQDKAQYLHIVNNILILQFF